MPEPETSWAKPIAAPRSRRVTVAAIILLLLPPLLPFPFWGLANLWIGSTVEEKVLACASFDCPAAVDWYRLTWLVILGPSFLVAVIFMLFGMIGLFRARWRPISPEQEWLFHGSVIGGLVWALLFGCTVVVRYRCPGPDGHGIGNHGWQFRQCSFQKRSPRRRQSFPG